MKFEFHEPSLKNREEFPQMIVVTNISLTLVNLKDDANIISYLINVFRDLCVGKGERFVMQVISVR